MRGRYVMVVALSAACTGTPQMGQCRIPARAPAHHFYDAASNPIDQFEPAWVTLEKF